MDLRWQMAMLTMRARRFLQKTSKNPGANGPTSMRFDMSKVECYNCHRMRHFFRECRSPKDPRRPGAAEPQRRTVPVETSTSNALVSQYDGTGSYDWSYQAEEEPANFALMPFSSNSSSDNEVPSCSKAYAQLHTQYDKLTDDFRKSQFDVISYQTGLESVEARLLFYKQNESVFEENIKLLNIEVELRDTALITLRHKLEKADQERDDLKLKLEKFQTSSKNLTDLLASQTNEKTRLGYNSQVFTKAMFDCENYYSSESDCESLPPSNLYDRFQPSGRYHAVPPPYTGTFTPPKPDLVFNTASTAVETNRLAFNQIETTIPAATPVPASPKSNSSGQRRNRKACFVCKSVDHLIKDCDYHTKKMAQPTPRNYAHRGHPKQYAPLTHLKPQKHMVPTAVLTQSKLVSIIVVRPVSAALPNISVTRPRHAHQVVTKFNSPIRRHITRSPSSRTGNSPPKVTAVQALVGNPQHALKDKGVIDSGCSRHMTWNMSYLSDFEELNRGYVAFGGNPKGGKITGKGKIKTGKFQGKVDEGYLVGYSVCSKAFRVFNSRTRVIQETLHVNFLENKPNVAGTGPTWLFDIDSLTKTMNYQPVHAGNQTNVGAGFQDNFDAEKAGEEVDQSYMLFPVWSVGSTNPQNNAKDVAFDGKEQDFDVKKPESTVILSPSSSAQSKEQDDKIKKEAKGKNASQLPDDPDMSKLEDYIYSNDEDVVGAEADFNNLESSIPVSPIPTTRIYKDHPVSQTIGDLSLTTQTRSMTRAIKDQGGLSQMFGNDFHTCMFACFLSQEEPKRVHQALKDPSWIEAISVCLSTPGFEDPDHPDKVYKVVKALYGLHQAPRAWYETLATYLLDNGFQRGTIDQTLFIKKQKKDILLVQIYVNDIIFGATNKDLCRSFEKLMKDKFQMSSMG
nr:putative ribonuclease H-like domain-containing protein [Tanacetum cinerariifolium]